MVIPQFSIRLLIVVTAVVAVLAMIASWGGQGIAWAIGATAALVTIALTMLVHAAMFGLIWLLSPLFKRQVRQTLIIAPLEAAQLQAANGTIVTATSPPPAQPPV